MAAQSLLAKLGVRLGTLGTSSSLAMAFPTSEGAVGMDAHTAANRTGFYAVEGSLIGNVVNGVEVLTAGVGTITAHVPLSTPATTTSAAGINIGQGTAPVTPVNGDLWITSSGFFAQAAGSTVGPFSTNVLTAVGDLIYGGAAGVQTRLPGNITTPKQFLTQTGTGSASAAPVWGVIGVGDVPPLPASIITSGVVSPAVGGTGLDTSAAANGTLLIGTGSGLALTTLTQGANAGVTIANGPGTITFTTVQDIRTSASPTFAGATLTGLLTTVASTTVRSGLNVPPGTAPTSPVNGDVWATASGLFVQVAGATVGPLGAGGGSAFPVSTATYAVQDVTTPSKQQLWNLSGQTATTNFTLATQQTTTQSLAFPNVGAGDTVVTRNVANAFTAANTFGTAVTPIAITGGAATAVAPPSGFTFVSGAHTALTAGSAGAPDVLFDLSTSRQWTGGSTVTNWVGFVVKAPVLAATSATTFAAPVTFEITGPPIGGTNGTVSGNISFLVNSGNSQFNGNLVCKTSPSNITISQGTASSGAITSINMTTGTLTNQTASTENSDINFDLSHTVQHATGPLTTQRAFRVAAPTYSFVGASTLTTAATFAVSGAPIAGTNATLTNTYAIWVQTGTTALAAATTAAASLNIASSAATAPTSPKDGDMWYDGTNVKFQVGGTTKTFTLT